MIKKTKIFVGGFKAIKTMPMTKHNLTGWVYLWRVVSVIGVTFLPFLVFAAISCVEESGEPANMTKCLRWAGPLPSQMRECRVPCRDDCTLTAWSKFSDCAGCGSSRTRKRSLIGKNLNFHSLTVGHSQPLPVYLWNDWISGLSSLKLSWIHINDVCY